MEYDSDESKAALSTGMKRLFRYFGSKWSLAPTFASMFPPHKTYVEPFFGSGAVFFNKPMAQVNILNDLNDNVWNFFTVVRERPEELKAMVDMTPYARAMISEVFANGWSKGDRIKWAWEFYCFMSMSRGASDKLVNQNNALRRSYNTNVFVDNFFRGADNFAKASRMLRNATFENRCVLKILDDIGELDASDREGMFVFMDPPYNAETRIAQHKYTYDVLGKGNEFEDTMLEKISRLDVKMMVCGYDCDKYNEACSGWNKKRFTTIDEGKNTKTEIVWYNFEPYSTEEMS